MFIYDFNSYREYLVKYKWMDKILKKLKNDIGRIRTCAGKPNGFQVHRLNHSATMSSQYKLI